MAYIEGIEKPSLKFHNKKMYFHFSDQVCQSTRYINKNIAPNMYAIEPFFWSADAPLIPVKQSHIIKKVLESDEDFAEMFFGSKPTIDTPRLMDKYIYKYSKRM